MCLGDISVQPAARVAVAALSKDTFEQGDVAPASLTTEEWRTLPPKDIGLDNTSNSEYGGSDGVGRGRVRAGAVVLDSSKPNHSSIRTTTDRDPMDPTDADHRLPMLLESHDMAVFADGFSSGPMAYIKTFDQVHFQ